jgi:hypothetical protein
VCWGHTTSCSGSPWNNNSTPYISINLDCGLLDYDVETVTTVLDETPASIIRADISQAENR